MTCSYLIKQNAWMNDWISLFHVNKIYIKHSSHHVMCLINAHHKRKTKNTYIFRYSSEFEHRVLETISIINVVKTSIEMKLKICTSFALIFKNVRSNKTHSSNVVFAMSARPTSSFHNFIKLLNLTSEIQFLIFWCANYHIFCLKYRTDSMQ